MMALLLSQANYSPPELIAKVTETATRPNGTSAPKLLLYVYTNDTSLAINDKPVAAASRLSSCWAGNIIIVISVLFLVFREGVGL